MVGTKPHFPAIQCAEVLGYKKPHDAVTRHCPHSVKHRLGVQTGKKADGSPAMQKVEKLYIPEGDLYRLIIRSKLPTAIAFEKWVFDIVLPEIRQHGAYVSSNVLNQLIESPEVAKDFFATIKSERETKDALEGQARLNQPKIHYYDTILQNPDAITVSVIAQDYDMTATKFNRLLGKLRIQYRHRKGSPWIIYYKYKKEGYTTSRTGKNAAIHTCWTQKGRKWLYTVLKEHGIIPTAEKLARGDLS